MSGKCVKVVKLDRTDVEGALRREREQSRAHEVTQAEEERREDRRREERRKRKAKSTPINGSDSPTGASAFFPLNHSPTLSPL